jgi:predicted transcriptional regulator
MTFQIMDPKRRDRLVIMMDILSIAVKGAPKTRIMLKANLSFSQLNEYISFLLNHRLLEGVTSCGKAIYRPTLKGLQFIERQQNVLGMIAEGDQNVPPIMYSGRRNKVVLANLNSQ